MSVLLTDQENADEVAGKLLGRVQCNNCHKYRPKDEIIDTGSNIEWYVCKNRIACIGEISAAR